MVAYLIHPMHEEESDGTYHNKDFENDDDGVLWYEIMYL